MTSICVSAPGKVVLSGEYAVLRGAPAVSTAVDRRAVVRIVATEDNHHCVSTPGYAEGNWRFTADSVGRISWLDERPSAGQGLVESAWRAVHPEAQAGLSITVDTSEFFATTAGVKLGLGSSAAAMTALVAALDQLQPGKSDVYALSRSAHTALQLGYGSGVDIATSFFGGVIEFRASAQDEPLRRPWPDGLNFRFLWSGTPVSTKEKIATLGVSDADSASWDSLSAAAAAASAAWVAGDAPRILNEFRRYTDALRQFSVDLNLGIFDAGHAALVDLAASVDLVYKPCGAGGGDIGIVLAGQSDDSKRGLEQFCNKATSAGFELLSLLPDASGVSISSGNVR